MAGTFGATRSNPLPSHKQQSPRRTASGLLFDGTRGRLRQLWLPFYPYAYFCDAGNHFLRHQMPDADLSTSAFLQPEGQVLRLVLMIVDAEGQGIAFGIGQGVADCVAAANAFCLVALFHGKHNVLYAYVCHRAKSDEERAVDVLFNLRHLEAYGVAPLPTFLGQRLVTVEHRAARTRQEQQTTQKKDG